MGMELVLIRHGESEANHLGLVQGHFDSPLSALGHLQATALSEALAAERFTALYASDLARARETAETIASRQDAPLIVDPLVRELDIGIFSGRTWADIRAQHPEDYRRFKDSGQWSVVPGAESEEAILARLDAFTAKLRAHPSGARIAVVAHGAILRRLIHVLLKLPFPSGVFFELHNASYSEIHLTPEGPTLLYLNRIPSARISSATTRSLL